MKNSPLNNINKDFRLVTAINLNRLKPVYEFGNAHLDLRTFRDFPTSETDMMIDAWLDSKLVGAPQSQRDILIADVLAAINQFNRNLTGEARRWTYALPFESVEPLLQTPSITLYEALVSSRPPTSTSWVILLSYTVGEAGALHRIEEPVVRNSAFADSPSQDIAAPVTKNNGSITLSHWQIEYSIHHWSNLGRILHRFAPDKIVKQLYNVLEAPQREYLDELFKNQYKPFSPSPELVDVIEKIQKLTPDLIAHLRRHEDDLIKVHWRVFEHLIAEFFASWGFDDVRLVGTNPRTSADIYVAKIVNPVGLETRYFIEVKRWKDKIGIEVINQVLGAMLGEKENFGWHAAVIVTLGGFTEFEKWDRQQLEFKGIKLTDRNDLLRWLRGYKENDNGLWLPKPSTLL